MNPKTLAWLLAISFFALGILLLTASVRGQEPTPGPTPTDEQLMNLPEDEILRTIEHRNELAGARNKLDDQLVLVLKDQAMTISQQKVSLDKATVEGKKLQTEVDRQAGALSDCKTLAEKRNTAIWIRNSVIGLLVVAIGGYLVAKFYLHLPI